jgi:hypothetical protein
MNGQKSLPVWTPQPGPQTALIKCDYPEVFYGGARGGGKTDGVLGKWALKERRYGQHFNAIMFRRTTVSAVDAIERSKEIYGPLGGRFVESPTPKWRMPNGGRVTFAHLESISDADEYQGRNVTDAWIEEVGTYSDPIAIKRLFGVLRSAHGVPVQLILTGNPGGVGQHWVAAKYQIIPFPSKPKLINTTLENGDIHRIAVIPSRITDNKILLDRDPQYVSRLQLVGKQLSKAWIDGDWTAIEGAYFDCWSEARHVIPPFQIPQDWIRFRSADWGSNSPFSIGWWAVVQDDHRVDASGETAGAGTDGGRESGTQRVLPRGAIVRYREWYGAQGGKLTADIVGQGIADRESDDPKLSDAVLDPSTFDADGGPSIAERINDVLIKRKMMPFRKADNKRVPLATDRRGALSGWNEMRQRLVNGMIACFSTCRDSIRTIPVLQHDPMKAEDLDTKAEDHAADEWRYACMSRPWLKSKPIEEEFKFEDYRVNKDDPITDSFKTI